MPSLRNSLVALDPKRYQRVDPHPPVAEPFRPNPAPEPPITIRRSSVFLSSLPPISTEVDGILRQFYGGSLPMRRLVNP
jgi:hypothetical protein